MEKYTQMSSTVVVVSPGARPTEFAGVVAAFMA